MLLGIQWKKGFSSHQWFTFHQIKQQGGSVKKGAKSQAVNFWKINEKEEQMEDEKKKVAIFKTYQVFNQEQTTLTPTIVTPTHSMESIDTLIEKLGVGISHFGNQAYYEDHHDVIVLPSPDRFASSENYYATLLHELIHWTATKNRVPRECFDRYHQDKKARAEEELIAEIGSVLLAAHYGVKGGLENHASYIQDWKQLLPERQVMSAAKKAAKAFEWLVNKSKEGSN